MLTGAATYVDDLDGPLIADCAHAVFVRSTMAHANITVDLADAATASGVLAVIASEQNPIWPLFAHAAANPGRFAQPLLAENRQYECVIKKR